ncbi:kelch-like protein 38 [Watersipora subatra]|uniref:kelch-like protein 38 n=1 Tax=Watersipora subatra TaxID=2589382 RepID=UPI00355B8F15
MNGHLSGYKVSSSTKKVLINTDLASDILTKLNNCRLKKQFTDAILSVDQEELHCHRCVLAASSPYFKATFSSHFQEAIESRITLHDVSPWIMKRILEYIYSGQLEISLETAVDYLRTGHMLQYPYIVQACCDMLSRHLHPNNCLGIKELASLYECTDLEATAFDYVLEHFTTVAEQSEELAELSLSSLVTYLSADNADIGSEAVIWQALIRWTRYDAENRKEDLYELLSCVRLSVLSSEELSAISNDPLVCSQPKCLQLIEKALNKLRDSMKSSANVCDTRADSLLLQNARPSTLPRDMLVLFGGSSDYELSETVGYDPVKDRWTNLPPLPERVVRASVTAHDSAIFLSGGIVNNVLSDALWVFCCKMKTWTRGKSLMEARAKHSSVLMNGYLYLSGGVRMAEDQSVVPMAEIHSYHLKSGVWRRVGYNNIPKVESHLLGVNETLYELGGQSNDLYNMTMETYRVSPGGSVTRTDEHYVLPCSDEPGPLRAALHGNDHIIILWEKTGNIVSVNTTDNRLYRVNHTLGHVSGCLVTFSHHAYILGGYEDGKPSTEGKILDLRSESYKRVPLPPGLQVQKSVRVRM